MLRGDTIEADHQDAPSFQSWCRSPVDVRAVQSTRYLSPGAVALHDSEQDIVPVGLACSPFSDPDVMKV